jgi:hypothetical protein
MYWLTLEMCRAAARCKGASDGVEQSGFTGAIGPDQPRDGATLEAQAHIVDSPKAAKRFRNTLQFEHPHSLRW